MKRILLIAGGVLALLLIAAGIVPFLIPNEVYQRQIERSASTALGREVTLEGNVGLSIFPRISARVEGVKVANPEGFSRANMIEAGELRGVVKWGPLLASRVEVAEIAFVDADVMLERRADGETNWTFGSGEAPPEEDTGGEGGGSVDAGIDRARLQNARLVYSDDVTGAYYDISELDLSATARAMDAPLEAEAEGLFQGTPFSIDLGLDTPQALLDGAVSAVNFALDTEGGAASYDGSATLGEAIALDGAFTVDGRNLATLATLAGVEMPINLAALGRVRAEGNVSGLLETLQISFDRFDIVSDGLSAGYDGLINLGAEPA
ncbi:MAG: AsmA family protein, partial [Hyphomonadaceae bacterium]|nr:AsmA family protein [Hyphomonadaceae bacterium]